ncbi:kelch-like protein 42 [Branchiostoma floridae]|uniref:Kelch-like protein 42 n=1 Tax=Branchiostoma floridae TaxID=7739 RepID=A0A9J7LB34_BRAFL|nr:kelch-like protein 42 [Branchiostoma floridae]
MAAKSKRYLRRRGSNEITYEHVHGDPDLEIKVESRTFKVHKVVLIHTCGYFDAMLECGMRESLENYVDLQGFDADAFEIILDFLYSPEPVVIDENLDYILELANFLQVHPLLQYMKGKVNKGNCIHLYILADAYNAIELKEVAGDIISRNYYKFLRTEDFKRLLPEQQDEVLQGRFRNRRKYLGAINNGYVFWPEPGPRELMKYDEKKDTWTTFASKPDDTPSRGFAVAALHNYIYIAGGHGKPRSGHASGLGDPQLTVYTYNPLNAEWAEVCSLGEARAFFGFVEYKGRLYAIGGFHFDYGVQSVERYDPMQDKWTFLEPLPNFATDYGMGVVCKDDIYISSEDFDTSTFSLLKYSPVWDEWDVVSELPRERDRHCMASVNDVIYILGGHVPGVDCYNVSTQQWFVLEEHPATESISYDKGCGVKDGVIYVLNHEDTVSYLTDSETWVQGLAPFPGGFYLSMAFEVYLPEKNDACK